MRRTRALSEQLRVASMAFNVNSRLWTWLTVPPALIAAVLAVSLLGTDQRQSMLVVCSCMLGLSPVLLFHAYRRDVRERQETEAALRESEERYRRLVDLNPNAIAVEAEGKIRYINCAGLKLLGAESPGEVLGKPLDAFVHSDTREALRGLIERSRTVSVQAPLADSKFLRLDGSPVDVEVSTIPFAIDGKLAVQVILHDLSDRKQTAARLRNSELRYKRLFDNVLEGVYQSTADGRIISANKALADILGFASEEELATVDVGRMLYVDPLERKVNLERLEREGILRNAELTLRRKDGELITVLDNCRVVRDEHGRVLHYEGTLTDITDRKNAEQQLMRRAQELEEARRQLIAQSKELIRARDEALQAARSKSEFLGNISHEVRTPMNAIVGMTRLLLDTPLDDRQRDCAQCILKAADYLLEVLDDILDLSYLESGRETLAEQSFRLRDTVQDVMRSLAKEAEIKGLDLACLVQNSVPDAFYGDPARLRRVLLHVVRNAIKFTDHGQVLVQAAQMEAGRDEVTVRFEVRDSGIGIPAEALGRIFEPFSQVDASASRRYGGTGLGLALSKKLVERMGGVIGVSSREGEGSVFWFTLRLRTAPQAARPPQGVHPPAGTAVPAATGFRRVLLAEDNPVNQRVAKFLLEKLGCSVDIAASGIEVLEKMSGQSYDCVLMDCQMPEMDGFAATAEIRKREGGSKHTPIVAMTAHAMQGDRQRCIESGMDEYVTKPVSIEGLKQALEKAEAARVS
jgi:PAS domain S-box-containing protein